MQAGALALAIVMLIVVATFLAFASIVLSGFGRVGQGSMRR